MTKGKLARDRAVTQEDRDKHQRNQCKLGKYLLEAEQKKKKLVPNYGTAAYQKPCISKIPQK